MAYGTLPNIANAGHEPTPDARAELIGIEINGKWAEQAAQRLPQAQIITAAVEHVTIAPNSISLAMLNPPYLVTNGGRMELQVFRQLCDAVMSHGVIACIIPARSAWARRCYDVRAWKFPSSGDIEDRAGFERYSQIVVVGYKHPQPLAEADERDIALMQQWRYTRDCERHCIGPPSTPLGSIQSSKRSTSGCARRASRRKWRAVRQPANSCC